MKFINQHSFLIFTGACLSLAALIIGGGGISTARLLVLFVLALVLASLYLIFNPSSSSDHQLQSRIASGKPVLLEFQSRF